MTTPNKEFVFKPEHIAILSIVVCLLMLLGFLAGEYRGSIGWHFRPSEANGVPTHLQEHNIMPLYQGTQDVGGEGQYSFYVANDIFGSTSFNTRNSIDAPAMRYQRIALPLISKIISIFQGRNWVSPTTYFLTNLLILWIGIIHGAKFLIFKRRSPFWILAWSLSLGCLWSINTGTIDTASDAFLIMGCIGFLTEQHVVMLIGFSLALLAKETNFFLVAMLIGHSLVARRFERAKILTFAAVPFICWFLYIFQHFDSNAIKAGLHAGFYDFVPLRPWFFAIQSAWAKSQWNSWFFLALWLSTIAWVLAALVRLCISHREIWHHKEWGLGAAFIALTMVQTHLGPVVFGNGPGEFFRAISIAPWMLLFSWIYRIETPGPKLKIVFFGVFIVPTFYGFHEAYKFPPQTLAYGTILQNYEKFPDTTKCLSRQTIAGNVRLQIVKVGLFTDTSWLLTLLRRLPIWTISVRIANNSREVLPVAHRHGGTYLEDEGHHRINFLQEPLAPGKNIVVAFNVQAKMPPSHIYLKQTDCSDISDIKFK